MKQFVNLSIYLIIITTAFALHVLYFNYFVSDDAYISFRYAKNFINGHGLVWNIGEKPVEGYTNFLWVIVISIFMKMTFEPALVSKVLGTFFGLFTILMVYLFPVFILQRKNLLNLIAPVILACCGPFAAWSTGGLETHMFTAFILAGAIAYLYEMHHEETIPLSSSILFTLACLTRPEGLLIFGVTCLHRFFHLYLSKKNPFCLKTIIWFFTFLTIYGLYFYWRFNYYGFLFPNTFYAKTGGGIDQLWSGYRYLKLFVMNNTWSITIILSFLTLLTPSRSPVIYLLLLTVSFSAYIVAIGGDFFPLFRFFVPLVPFMAILAQEGLINLCQWLLRLKYPKVVKLSAITFCFFIFMFSLTQGFLSSYNKRGQLLQGRKGSTVRGITRGKWLRQHASPNDTLAAFAIGAISYYSELNTIDRLGITDVHIAHVKMRLIGDRMPGHDKRDLSYIISREPTYIFGPLIYRKFKPPYSAVKKFYQLYEPFYIEYDDVKERGYKLKENKNHH
jgi:hypothetical protein